MASKKSNARWNAAASSSTTPSSPGTGLSTGSTGISSSSSNKSSSSTSKSAAAVAAVAAATSGVTGGGFSQHEFVANVYGEDWARMMNSTNYDPFEPLGHVVRILRLSSDEHERSKKREALVNECNRLEAKMDEIISVHYNDLNESMRIFQNVVGRITDSKQRIVKLRAGIARCKQLLQFKRDKLHQLWIEHIEYKEMIRLLDKVETVRRVPDQIDVLIGSNHYLRATRLVVETINTLEIDLSGVSALGDLQQELREKKKMLFDVILEELHKQVYQRNVPFETSAAAAKRRAEQAAAAADVLSPAKTTQPEPQSDDEDEFVVVSAVEPFDPKHRPMRDHAIDDDMTPNPERDPAHYVFMLLESLALLQQLPATVKALEQRLSSELSRLVQDAVVFVENTFVINNLNSSSTAADIASSNVHQPMLLVELLNVVFARLCEVLKCHVFVLQVLRYKIRQHETSVKVASELELESQLAAVALYSENDIWSAVQHEVQLLLCDYLNVPKDTHSAASTFLSSINTPEDINDGDILLNPSSLFHHKAASKKKLFSFSNSHHAMALQTVTRQDEQRRTLSGLSGLPQPGPQVAIASDMYSVGESGFAASHLLCHPDPRNVVHIFAAVMTMTRHAETDLLPETSVTKDTLRQFLTDFVDQTFLRLEKEEVTRRAKLAMEDSDAFKVPRDGLSLAKDTQFPLLHSAANVERVIRQVCFLPLEMPAYANEFMSMVTTILDRYLDLCQNVTRGAISGRKPAGSVEIPILSGVWATNERMVAVMQQYNSWQRLKGRPDTTGALMDDSDPALYEEEFTLQSASLENKPVAKTALIYDLSAVSFLAHLHHSLEWFARHVRLLLRRLVQMPDDLWNELSQDPQVNAAAAMADPLLDNTSSLASANQPILRQADEDHNISPALLATVSPVVEQLRDLSRQCLMTLRLEVRSRCFYSLLPVMQKSNYYCDREETEPDPLVAGLNKELNILEETMAAALSPAKIRFIFDGVPHLCKSILMRNLHSIKRINKHGVNKMCRSVFALEQNLSNITKTGDVGLDRARAYFELLVHKREDILADVEAEGPGFTLEEYKAIFELIHKSKTNEDPTIHSGNIERLELAISRANTRLRVAPARSSSAV
ncbi:hypothetical protein CAOG_007027 [Capsaspora owczarzaki ATCC 30864]|uniref:Exocyst complex component Sec8 n=1 Tax=Capsaspora owczarzaki (strain ATCC 30864) TaxID=595528 RepID=A0A0D2WVA7_CAPO3|nr:hypothetical protein CAOG_007027 [Capsaspora owczarzaki ATCC 30864]